MRNGLGTQGGRPVEWSAADLRRALLRRANFRRAGRRRNRSGPGLAHAGVPRRVIRRLAIRAAASLVRGDSSRIARPMLLQMVRGSTYDERVLALEILGRLAELWPAWAAETTVEISRGLDHPWVADRLARIQGRLLARGHVAQTSHLRWALSANPLRRRASALALLCRSSRGGIPVARMCPVLRILLRDPEPHPWVLAAVGAVLVHLARRAPRTTERLLREPLTGLAPRHIERVRTLLAALPPAS